MLYVLYMSVTRSMTITHTLHTYYQTLQYSPVFPFIALSSEHIIGIHLDDICSPYKEWVTAWKAHFAGSPADVRVPHEATAITTPLNAMN